MAITVQEINSLQSLASPSVLSAVGGTGVGIFGGEYVGELAKTTLGQTGWVGFGVKAGVQTLLAILTGLLAFATRGLARIFLVFLGIGSMGAIIPDLIAMVYPGGAVAGGQITGLQMRELALGAQALSGNLAGGPHSPVDYAGNHLAPSVLRKTQSGVTDFTGM
jgi:hypothetical protein